MIVDSHVYCFQPADHPAGHASSEEHLKWLQTCYALHHQPAWRVRDRQPASSKPLDPDGCRDLSDLPDLNFRADHERGRMVWTIDGEDYTKQMHPPNLRNLEFTPHSLIAEMDYARVDVALLHVDTMLGRDLAYLADCVRQYPDRLRSMTPVDEWRIINETDAVIDELTTAIIKHGLHAIKFMPDVAYHSSFEPWDDGPYRPFWEAATSLKVPVFFTISLGTAAIAKGNPTADDEVGALLNELKILMRWMERYPQTTCSITHGLGWRMFLEGDRIRLPEAIWEPFGNPNLNLEVCFPIRIGDLFDFPYREVWPALEEIVNRIGADHLLWGTDMPFQNRFCTYRQSRDWIEKYCDFLSPKELAMIMGGTAANILRL